MTIAVAVPVQAQLANGKWQAPAQSGGSAAATPRKGVQTKRDGDATATAANTNVNGAVPLRVIHAVVMSDGSIFADFGAGLEPVRRACPSSTRDMPLRIIGGAATSPDPNSQPAPAQMTESQKLLPSAQQRAAANAAAQQSCHLRDARGRAFATR